MSALFDDIINAAIDGNQPLPDILRKCLLLGHELKNKRLIEWANQELNGYKSGKDVPEYRVIPAQAKGNFVGPFYAQYNRHIIPPAVLEERHREFAEKVYLVQSITAYAEVVKESKPSGGGSAIFNWPANMVGFYQDKLLPDFICHAAWQEVPPSAIAELLDTVRNLTLNMALGIKDELGTSYTDLHKIESKEKEAKIQNIIFQNTGGNTNVAFGQAKIDASGQVQTVIHRGDRKALDEALTKAGLNASDLKELTDAIQIDGGKNAGNKVGEWIKTKASKVLVGGVKVSVSIGQQLLTEWLMQHYGLKK